MSFAPSNRNSTSSALTSPVDGTKSASLYAAASPGAGFKAVPSGLEDVYFLHLSRHAKN